MTFSQRSLGLLSRGDWEPDEVWQGGQGTPLLTQEHLGPKDQNTPSRASSWPETLHKGTKSLKLSFKNKFQCICSTCSLSLSRCKDQILSTLFSRGLRNLTLLPSNCKNFQFFFPHQIENKEQHRADKHPRLPLRGRVSGG